VAGLLGYNPSRFSSTKFICLPNEHPEDDKLFLTLNLPHNRAKFANVQALQSTALSVPFILSSNFLKSSGIPIEFELSGIVNSFVSVELPHPNMVHDEPRIIIDSVKLSFDSKRLLERYHTIASLRAVQLSCLLPL
jgi:hypothetical protein